MKLQRKLLNTIEENGFELLMNDKKKKSTDTYKIFFHKEPKMNSLKQVLQTIPRNMKIRFYNDDPKVYDEQGGYCQVIILDNESAMIMENNHEWNSEWSTISMDDLVYLMKDNWSLMDAWGKYKNYFVIEENKYANLITFCNLSLAGAQLAI